jgi:CheY-specific phosphatase CheX
MSIKFFGQFLLENNVIIAEQLLEAVRFQESKNLKFGDYACSKGYLTEEDVERLQEEQKRTDMMIGELTVKLGMLKQGQVEEILTMQKNDHVFIGGALVQKGFITDEKLNEELERFKEDQKGYMPGEVSVPEDIEDPKTIRNFVDLTRKMLRRVAHLDVKVGEGHINVHEPEENYSVVSISFTGAMACEYVLSVSRETAAIIATGITGGDATNEPDDIITDGVKEFCNIVCGNIMAGMAKKGKTVDISPPSEAVLYPNGYNIIKRRKAVHYPMVSTEEELLLILIEG